MVITEISGPRCKKCGHFTPHTTPSRRQRIASEHCPAGAGYCEADDCDCLGLGLDDQLEKSEAIEPVKALTLPEPEYIPAGPAAVVPSTGPADVCECGKKMRWVYCVDCENAGVPHGDRSHWNCPNPFTCHAGRLRVTDATPRKEIGP